jgi:cGMP-dependent protein kinase
LVTSPPCDTTNPRSSVAEGSCEIIIDDKKKKELTAGSLFGEYAILYNAPRSASVRALEDSRLWGLDRVTFRKAIEELMNKQFQENRVLVENTKIFEPLTKEQKESIAHNLITQSFETGQVIIHEGDQASSFYLIKSGKVSISKHGTEILEMGPGDYFGEQALYVQSVRQLTATALDATVLLGIGGEAFAVIMGHQMDNLVERNFKLYAIQSNKHLSKMSPLQVEKFLNHLKRVEHKAGDVVVRKEAPMERIIIVLKGSLISAQTQEVFAGPAMAVGASWLAQNGNQLECQPSPHSDINDDLIMNSDEGITAEITFAVFENLFGNFHEAVEKDREFQGVRTLSQLDLTPPSRE